MAKLSSKALANFTAASSALILTESLRLIRNYRYYNDLIEDKIYRDQLISKVREARKHTFTLQNLMSRDEPDEAPFFVTIAGAINDLFEEIHRKVLFFDSEEIVDIIPIIDSQRKFWKEFDQVHFYNLTLVRELDSTIPEALIKIEKKLIGLPRSVCV